MRALPTMSLLPTVALTMILVACTGDDPTDEPDTDNPGDTDTDTDTDTTAPGECAGHALLRALEIPEAYAAFDACVQANPADTNALFGRALTNTMRINEWDEPTQLLDWCNESFSTARAYGNRGLYRIVAEGDDGTVDLETRYAPDAASSGTEFELFSSEPVIYSFRGDDLLTVDLDPAFSGHGSLRIRLDPDDVYRDGSRVELTDGLVIDVSRGRGLVRMSVPCEVPFSECYGWEIGNGPSGTITVDQAGARHGETLALTLNVITPGWCESSDCSAEHRIAGTIEDTVLDEPSDSDLPFYDIDEDDLCRGDNCGSFIPMNFLAEACNVPSLGAIHDEVGAMADDFAQIAEDFEAAGADPDLAFVLPHQAAPRVRTDMTLNAADSLALAASFRAAITSVEAVEQYDLAGEDLTAESYVGAGRVGEWDWASETCIDSSYYGMSAAETARTFNTYGLEHRDSSDFSGMETAFGDMVDGLRAVIASEPGSPGILKPDWDGNRRYFEQIDRDLEAMQTSLGGTEGTRLPTASSYRLTLSEFFDSPPDRDRILREAGRSDYFYLSGRCDSRVELEDEVAYWLAEGSGMVEIPREVIDGDLESYPALIDYDLYEGSLDRDEVPEWLNRDTLESIGFEF